VEHYVTHEPGYAAVDEGCTERITVELYPLKKGWTAFARYSGREREEKVDVLYYDELPRFAERVVAALLYGKDIATTATLRTVLQADSVRRYRTIKGLHYFSFAIGGAVRVAELPSYDRDNQAVSEKWRVLTPLTFAMGYRGRFNAWALDSYVRGSVGLQRLSLQADAGGNHVGHVDLGGMFDVALHFLRYYEPHGMISFYYGAGAQFDLTVLTSIRPSMADGERDQIVGGGLNVDLVIGFEFLRASGVQFFLQLVAAAPVWIFDNQSRYSRHIEAYTPEVGLALGILL
jgi:hypothetical protein